MNFARPSRGHSSSSAITRKNRRPTRACRPAQGLERFEERMLLSAALVSVNVAGTAAGNSTSDFIGTNSYNGPAQPTDSVVSADGTRVVFVSQATNLVASLNDTNHSSDVFVRDLKAGQTSLVSVTPDGKIGNSASFGAAISPDGRYVAFISQSTNLTAVTPGATANNAFLASTSGNLYVRDLQTGTTTLLDQTLDGKSSDGQSSGQFVFSPDSKSLAFVDSSDNLTNAPVDPNTGTSAGNPNLPPGSGPPPTYVYIRDLAGQTTSLVSVSTTGNASGSGGQGSSGPIDLVFSPDSQLLIFGSSATDLTSNPPDNSPSLNPIGAPFGNTNLFLRDLSAGTTTLLTASSDGHLTAGYSLGAVFSPTGHAVAFSSNVTTLTANVPDPAPSPGSGSTYPGPGSFASNIFLRDLTTGTTTLVSSTPNGYLSNATAFEPVFSPDGRLLAFTSAAVDLTINPSDPAPAPGAPNFPGSLGIPTFGSNAFVRDLSAGTTTLVSVTPDGKLSNGDTNQIVFSPDGHSLAFTSSASDLTKNALEPVPSQNPATTVVNAVPSQNPATPVVNAVTSQNPATPVVNAVTYSGPIANVFVRNLTLGTTSLASLTTTGLLSNATANNLIFSPDGRSLIFTSGALDLTSNPPDVTNAPGLPLIQPYSPGYSPSNLFVRDLAAGTTSLVSSTTAGKLSDGPNLNAFLSQNGKSLFFDSTADNMAPGASSGSTNIFAASAPFTVPNQIHFVSWQLAAKESDGKTAVTVVRTGPATAAASVSYTVQNDSAKGGTDFTPTSGVLNFAAGETSKIFTIPLSPSDHFDGTRSANLVLSNPQGATLGYPQAVLNLTADPAPPTPVTVPTAPAPKVTTPAPIPVVPGPTVKGVVSSTHGARVMSLVITFDRSLDPTAAQAAINYAVNFPSHTLHVLRGHRSITHAGRSIHITKTTYDPASHSVTLTLAPGLRVGQTFQLHVKGTSGGLTDATGVLLNSPGNAKPGSDYLVTLIAPSLRNRDQKTGR
jgi:hypothetical protein